MAKADDKRSVYAYLREEEIAVLERVVPTDRRPGERISLSEFVHQLIEVVECALDHCDKEPVWSWIREAVVLRARVPGSLRAGKLLDTRPMSLSDRARFFPRETRALITRAYRMHRGQRAHVERELGAAPGDLAVALRQLPGLAEELRTVGGAS